MFFADIAEEGDFLALLVRDRLFGAAHEDVGGDADALEFLDAVLRGLCLQLATGGEIGQKGEMHEDALSARAIMAELADRLKERQPLDIAHGAADFTEHEIDLIFANAQELLDFIGDMRDDLNGLAQIVAAPLLFQHVGIDAPRTDRVGNPRGNSGEALVMAKIEIGFGPIIGHEHLAMFKW